MFDMSTRKAGLSDQVIVSTKTIENRTDSTFTVHVTKRLTEIGSTNTIENRTDSSLRQSPGS